MSVSGINGGLIKVYQNPFQKIDSSKSKTSFANVLQNYMENVDSTVKQAQDITAKAAVGQVDNVQDVMIASEKSKIALELTVTIRDKAVEAYQEMMRMQI